MPNGEKGIVIKTQVLSVDNEDKLPPGVLKQVRVWVATLMKIDFGDKISGRHGDKNTVAAIKPVEDMPFTADGKPVDIVLTPAFIKRMNMGQVIDVHYGAIADALGVKFAFPQFEGVDKEKIQKLLDDAGIEVPQRVDVYDGRTGEKFPRQVTLGLKYTIKLHHIASTKVNARSTGPYTLIAQQPLGGKSQRGGQRFGEMEVWGLEAHGAASALQEMLTIKSDDIKGRANAYKSIIHGEPIKISNIPESFKVLIKELNALALNIDLISKDEEEENHDEQ
jgi:DNA-directed RNA polymerase subunit beta